MSSSKEVREVIKKFLNGTGGKWDWDDFLSDQFDDPVLERVRLLAVELPDRFPPDNRRHYASQEGLQILREIADQLEHDDLSLRARLIAIFDRVDSRR